MIVIITCCSLRKDNIMPPSPPPPLKKCLPRPPPCRYTYSMRESMLRLAGNKPEAVKAAKTYFVDLNDMFEWAEKKDGSKINAAYDKSVADMKAFKALVATN